MKKYFEVAILTVVLFFSGLLFLFSKIIKRDILETAIISFLVSVSFVIGLVFLITVLVLWFLLIAIMT